MTAPSTGNPAADEYRRRWQEAFEAADAPTRERMLGRREVPPNVEFRWRRDPHGLGPVPATLQYRVRVERLADPAHDYWVPDGWSEWRGVPVEDDTP